MSSLPALTRILINLTQGNSKIYGIVTAPKATSSSESFAPPQRMLNARRGSVVTAGDTVLDLGEHFVLGAYSKTVNDEILRMYPVPFRGEVMRKVTTQDPVSGFATNGGLTTIAQIWYDQQANGTGKDVDQTTRRKYQIITGYPLQPGDLLGPRKVVSVTTELGVTIAEAE